MTMNADQTPALWWFLHKPRLYCRECGEPIGDVEDVWGRSGNQRHY